MKCGDATDDAVPNMHLDMPVMIGLVTSVLALLVVVLAL